MPEQARQLVVIGASAGGIEALSTLVSTLPTGFLAPIVIAQHLDPTRLSHLQSILARKSTLPVRSVVSTEHLEPGVIYVVPSDRQVEITDHAVTVREVARSRPAPSIDRLLETAAEVFGEQLVAVILTGLGSDGADGARRVKELGGTVVIQNPQTATHPEMPLSLAPTTVDVVAELEAIGPLLNELLAGTYAPVHPEDNRRMRTLLERVRSRSGIDFSAYREPTIRRRLQRRMLDTGSASLDDYIQYLRRHPEEYDRLANSFLIKVTDFFRDSDLFNHLSEVLLPQLIDDARRMQRTELRLWSAGCATGEEAYSLAILVSELLGDDNDDLAVRVFATDVDAEAVAFARRGIYPASALKNVSPEMRQKYLVPVDSAFEVRKHVRSLVIFGQHDLGQRAPFPRIDLVLCRNVLIYFTPELQRRALQLFAFGLRDGGYLVLGKAESSSPLPEHFTLVDPRLKIFRRQGERVLIPPSRIRDATPLPGAAPPPAGRPVLTGMDRELARVHVRQPGLTTADRAEQVLLDLPIGVVVVDRHYDIQSINAAARRLLGIHNSAIGEDVVHLAHRGIGAPLRDAIDTALRGESFSEVHELDSLPESPGELRHFEVVAFGQHASERVEQGEMVVVLISDVTEQQQLLATQTRQHADAQTRAERLQALLDESTRTVRQLLQANQELTVTNAGLRSANEELLVGHEEAQAAMEEIETLNEEQQATNEELETLNEELQATVEELNATNEDLQARSVELQEQVAEREELFETLRQERERLSAVLGSMGDAVLVVNAGGEPLLTNDAFERQFGERLPVLEDGNGRPISPRSDPARRAARGETFVQPFTTVDAEGTRRWFEATGQPIRGDGTLGGGVVVIRDVSDRSLRQLQEEFVALAGHELRTPLTALRGSLQLIERRLPPEVEERIRRYLHIGGEQVALLTRLVEDLADIVRIQSGQLPITREHIELGEIVQTTAELARSMTDTQNVRVEIPSTPVLVDADRHRLQQALLNLVSNALQHGASEQGTDMLVRVEDKEAVIEVRDHGPGIPPEDRERVFERFYQADRAGGGLGVGLYLTHAIVVAHGGTITAHPTDGGGTTFTMRLPRAPDST